MIVHPPVSLASFLNNTVAKTSSGSSWANFAMYEPHMSICTLSVFQVLVLLLGLCLQGMRTVTWREVAAS